MRLVIWCILIRKAFADVTHVMTLVLVDEQIEWLSHDRRCMHHQLGTHMQDDDLDNRFVDCKLAYILKGAGQGRAGPGRAGPKGKLHMQKSRSELADSRRANPGMELPDTSSTLTGVLFGRP